MRDHYDFSKMKWRKNPYAKFFKSTITIRVDKDVIQYFKQMADKTGLPYQTLINFYLRDCASTGRQLKMGWAS